MSEQKTYVPKSHAKVHTFNDGGEILKLSFLVDDLIEFANKNKNAKGYLNLTVSKRRQVGQYGDTHSVALDTWKPKAECAAPAKPAATQEDDSSSVPF